VFGRFVPLRPTPTISATVAGSLRLLPCTSNDGGHVPMLKLRGLTPAQRPPSPSPSLCKIDVSSIKVSCRNCRERPGATSGPPGVSFPFHHRSHPRYTCSRWSAATPGEVSPRFGAPPRRGQQRIHSLRPVRQGELQARKHRNG
jgi:hypothetical protein